MQLFVCDFEIKKDQIIVYDQGVLIQFKKILRGKLGDSCAFQPKEAPIFRYHTRITDFDNNRLIGDVLETETSPIDLPYVGMIISMPNKRDKAEIITQKLTEIGVSDIIFWPAERSIIRTITIPKMNRLQKISKEALEQSWGWRLPKIRFIDDIKQILGSWDLYVFDNQKMQNAHHVLFDKKVPSCGIVGPEGGLSKGDYQKFGDNVEIRSLGSYVLRMETAAIIGGWTLVNS